MASAMHGCMIRRRRNHRSMVQTALALLITLTLPIHAGAEILSSVRTARLPEPGSLILLGTGLIAVAFWLGWSRRRHGRRSSPIDERR